MYDGVYESAPLDQCPVKPLGHVDGAYWFLSAAGELRRVSGRDLEGGRNVFDLFAGGLVNGAAVADWLALYFKPRRKRGGDGEARWSKIDVGEWLIERCHDAGVYDPHSDVRSLGVWRVRRDGAPDIALAHCGEALLRPEEVGEIGAVARSGAQIGDAVYPTVHRGQFPHRESLPQIPLARAEQRRIRQELLRLSEKVSRAWGWRDPVDREIWFGWLGQAVLGAYPEWRAHLWVHGRRGSGKSTLADLQAALLGPLSQGVLNDVSAAGVRQSSDRQARPFLFDETEPDASGEQIRALVEMFRNMSGEGAKVQRGSADHGARSFVLRGAASMSSIMPLALDPQDASRFVMINLGRLPAVADPVAAGRELAEIRAAAKALGARLWLYALSRAHVWDATFEAYRALVQTMGGEPRDGATIGAVLAGFDLLFSELDAPDDERLEAAKAMAEPMLEVAKAAAADGEGELCWARLVQSNVHFGAGEARHVGQLIGGGLKKGADIGQINGKLGRIGLRLVVKGDGAQRERDRSPHGPFLLVVPGAHPEFDKIYRGTRWAGGGHKAALMMLDGVRSAPKPTRIGGHSCRPLIVPAPYLPVAESGLD